MDIRKPGNEAEYTDTVSRLEQAWLLHLLHEFETICRECDLALRPPIFEVSASRRLLGSWSPGTRTIRLSGFLILTYPWWITVQVLRHEMAHQVCSEIYGKEDSGHGPGFKKACELLGVEKTFRAAAADTEEALRLYAEGGKLDRECDRIMEKVRKLTALGRSANEHEAALALQKANRLLRQYNLSPGSEKDESPFVRRTINTGMQRMAVHLRVLAALLEAFFSVRVVLATQYAPLQDRLNKTIELLGSVENTACAEHCFYFISDRLNYLWEYHRHSISGDRRTARKSYYLGVLAGFRETLEKEREQATDSLPAAAARQETRELAVISKKLDHFTTKHFPRLSRRKGRKLTLNADAYDKAHLEGRKIRLHQPVERSRSRKTRLIG